MISEKSLILLLSDQVPCRGGHVGAGGDLAEQRLQTDQDHDVRCDERGVALIDTNTNANRNIVIICIAISAFLILDSQMSKAVWLLFVSTLFICF